MRLPEDILWNIWTYAGPKSYFLDKELISIIDAKKKLFIVKPLRLYYKLCRWKKKHYYNELHEELITRRPNMYIELAKHLDLSGCPIGKVNDDQTLQISQQVADKLIPVSTIRESSNGFRLTILYWTVNSVWTIDTRTKLYSRLWPSWRHPYLETF
jgi:hypothetical protein